MYQSHLIWASPHEGFCSDVNGMADVFISKLFTVNSAEMFTHLFAKDSSQLPKLPKSMSMQACYRLSGAVRLAQAQHVQKDSPWL